jgi:arabinan endo-1,5-alpha-L-arabinosidase
LVLSATLLLAVGLIFPAWSGFGQTPALTPGTEPEIESMKAFGSRGIHVHDPSTIVRCNDEYWLFCTGRGVSTWHSKDLATWEPGPDVFTNAPAWTARAVPNNRWVRYWAPDIIHLGNRYLLYYSVSTFGTNVSAIGLATNPTLAENDPAFHWTDEGIVIQSTNTDKFNAIDPAVSQDADGGLWLAFGSFWSGIKLIQLDPRTGKRIATNSTVYSLAHNDSIEAAAIVRHGDFYCLFVNWGACCRGTNSTYEIRVGRSRAITGPYLDGDGVDLLAGGGSPFLGTSGNFIGPGHAGILSEGGTNWLSCHYYDGTREGLPTLAILPLRWNTNGWPEVLLKPKN